MRLFKAALGSGAASPETMRWSFAGGGACLRWSMASIGFAGFGAGGFGGFGGGGGGSGSYAMKGAKCKSATSKSMPVRSSSSFGVSLKAAPDAFGMAMEGMASMDASMEGIDMYDEEEDSEE